MILSVLLLAGAATVSASGKCSSCNLTLKSELRTTEILSGMKAKFGFDPALSKEIPAEVIAKAKKAFARSLHEKEDQTLHEAIHIFASDDDYEESNGARFHFHNDTKARSIERADLHLHIDKPESNPEERREVSINVYEAGEQGAKGELLASRRVLTPVHGPAHHRVRLNAAALERIAQSDSTVLIVEAFVDDLNLAILPGDDDADDHPMSLSLVMSSSRGRSRRSVKTCDRHAPTQSCCRFETTIDFKELGWTHIISPVKAIATGCAGQCGARAPVKKSSEPSREGLMAAIGETASCCHPVAFEDQDIIYVTPNHNAAQIKISNFYATSCACS